jgi:hypothetical protein
MALSLMCLIYEVWISGGALRILLNAVEEENIRKYWKLEKIWHGRCLN